MLYVTHVLIADVRDLLLQVGGLNRLALSQLLGRGCCLLPIGGIADTETPSEAERQRGT
eukprot:COSAG03_NODE_16320_length_405_cov_0.905229_2_plen_58_part_01